MVIKKIDELIVSNNDIYILNNSKDYIIINDNYEGLILLDHALCSLEKIFIFKGIHIYYLYQKYNDNNVLIYSPENEEMIFVDTNTKEHVVIKICTDNVYSPIYYWSDNIFLMVTFNGNFYQLCFESYILRQITAKEAEEICHSFFNFWTASRQYHVLKVYPEQQAFILKDTTKSVSCFRYPQQQYVIAKNFSDGWHDVECNNNIFLFIHEKKIEIIHSQDKTILIPYRDYIFLRAKFLNSNQIIVFSSKPSNPQECLLETYSFV
jgi:hypothetical protein